MPVGFDSMSDVKDKAFSGEKFQLKTGWSELTRKSFVTGKARVGVNFYACPSLFISVYNFILNLERNY
jgi:hypothetical protein